MRRRRSSAWTTSSSDRSPPRSPTRRASSTRTERRVPLFRLEMEMVEKLKQMYLLARRVATVVLPGELQKDHVDQVDAPDLACDAEAFFQKADQGLEQMVEQLREEEETPATSNKLSSTN